MKLASNAKAIKMSSAVKANRLWISQVGRQNKEFMHGSLITTSEFYRLVLTKRIVPNKISFRWVHMYASLKIMLIFHFFFLWLKLIKADSWRKSGDQKKE